jgi:serine/threonine-protein kinase RsbW
MTDCVRRKQQASVLAQNVALELPGTAEGLEEARRRFDQACRASEVDREAAARLLVVLDELYSNTVKYGYAGGASGPIRVNLTLGPERLLLVFEDEAPRFDPTTWNIEADLAKVADGAVGRVGIAVMRGLAAEIGYEYENGCNRITVEVATAPRQGAPP